MKNPQKPASLKLTQRQQAAFARFLETRGPAPFRRSDVAEIVYPLQSSPRTAQKADQLAAALIKDAAAAGELRREGHLHWVRCSSVRTLKSGRTVAEQPELVQLPISTHAPGKWAAVDLETGEIWSGTDKGWRRADKGAVAEVRDLVAGPAPHKAAPDRP
jgi:hypothetical protein